MKDNLKEEKKCKGILYLNLQKYVVIIKIEFIGNIFNEKGSVNWENFEKKEMDIINSNERKNIISLK